VRPSTQFEGHDENPLPKPEVGGGGTKKLGNLSQVGKTVGMEVGNSIGGCAIHSYHSNGRYWTTGELNRRSEGKTY